MSPAILEFSDLCLYSEHRYVVDTGIETTHPEFEGRMYEQYNSMETY